MIPGYRKKAIISVLIIISVSFLVPLLIQHTGKEWPMILLIFGTLAYYYTFISLSKGKGYSCVLGIALSFLSLIGVIVLLVLRDKTKLKDIRRDSAATAKESK